MPSTKPPEPPWEALAKVVDWQRAFVEVCLPGDRSLATPRNFDQTNCRTLGEEFREFLERVPQQMEASRQHGWVWLVDPRDQPRLVDQADRSSNQLVLWRPSLPQATPPPPPVKLDVTQVAAPRRLQWHKPVETGISFAATGLAGNRVTVHVQYDPRRLIVRRQSASDELPGEATFEFPLGAGETHDLKLLVESRRLAQAADEQADLMISLSAEDAAGKPRKTESQKLVVYLPLPSDVAVWTKRYLEPREEGEFAAGCRVRPYPNRTTPFTFELANRSQVPKEMKVELYAIPDPQTVSSLPPKWAPGRIFVSGAWRPEVGRLLLEGDENQTVRPVARKLAEALVSLPADEQTRVPVVLQPPGALAPKPAVADEAPDSKVPAATTPPPPDQSVDVSPGLALVITNTHDPSDRIVKWIAILPAHPSQYVQVNDVRFARRRLRMEVALRHPEWIPAVREKPVEVVWTNLDTDRFVNRAAMALLTDEPGRSKGELWAEVPPDISDSTIQLAVDDYPRAFAYDIRCADDEQGRSLVNRQLAIRIVGITPVYKTNPDPNKPPPEIPVHANPDGTSVLAIRSDPDNPCTHLVARVELDVPENAFETLDPLVSAHVDRHELFSDRQVRTQLGKLGPAGELLLTSHVADHQVSINVEGRTPVLIRAELSKRGEEGTSSQLTAILDGMAPRVQDLDNVPVRIEAESPLAFDVRFTDNNQAGVERLVVAVDVNASGTIDDSDLQKSLAIGRGERSCHVQLATDGLKPSADGYYLLAQATDRVGISSAVARSAHAVRVDPKKKVAPAKMTRGSIYGRVFYNDRPAVDADGTVTIKELQKTVPVEDAKFRFDNVPLGKYTLRANVDLSGYPYVTNPDAPPSASPKPSAEAKYTDYRIDLVRPGASKGKD